jgi:hypothetical protein
MTFCRVSVLVTVVLGNALSAYAQTEFSATLSGANEVSV